MTTSSEMLATWSLTGPWQVLGQPFRFTDHSKQYGYRVITTYKQLVGQSSYNVKEA